MSLEAWSQKSIGDLERDGLLDLRTGFAQGVHNEDGRGVPHVRPFNVTDDGRIDFDKIKFVEPLPDESPQWLQVGDVIFNNTNSEALTGKTALLESDVRCLASNHMTVLRATSEESPEPYWLAVQLRYLWATGVFRMLLRRYVGQATVSLTRLRDLEILLPPLPEQRAIAHVLRTVQQAKEATEQVITAAQELKKSLMRHVFTYGAVSPGVVSDIEMSTHGFPAHWTISSVGEIADVVVSSSGLGALREAAAKDAAQAVRVLYLKVSDLAAGGERYVEHSVNEFMLDVESVSILKLVPIGSTVFPKRGAAISTNRKRQNTELSAIDPNLAAVVARSVDGDYLYSWFDNYDLRTLVPPDVIPQINKKDIAPLQFAVPPSEEQAAIADFIGRMGLKIAAEEARRDALAALFDSLLHNLMTARLRVAALEMPA